MSRRPAGLREIVFSKQPKKEVIQACERGIQHSRWTHGHRYGFVLHTATRLLEAHLPTITIKAECLQLSKKAIKILFLFPIAYLW